MLRKQLCVVQITTDKAICIRYFNKPCFICQNNHIKPLLWEGDGFALYHKGWNGHYERSGESDNISLIVTQQQLLFLFLSCFKIAGGNIPFK